MGDLKQIAAAVVEGQAALVKMLVDEALADGTTPSDILYHGLIVGMDIVSARFSNEEFYVPDVLISSRAVHAGMRVVRPLLLENSALIEGKIAIGTVAGDLHDIGKNLVIIFLRSRGYEVVDLGIDVHPEEFVEAVLLQKPQVLGMSALLTTTMPIMASTVKLLEQANIRDQVRVIVGGGPVTHDYSMSIKADGYAADARSAVDLVNKCIRESKEEYHGSGCIR
ncbi:MAG: methyltransferase [Peptococcaceae bacterium BICA1-8]|nr:MAG: methyltransferase [Peptococcaceae bacterium BICA1-8]